MIDIDTRCAVSDLYAQYATLLDTRRYAEWVELFETDCRYELRPRENYDANLPLALMRFESKDMLRDRVYAITETLFHAPYYQRHIVSGLQIEERGTNIEVEANYLVIRTHPGCLSELFNAGRYLDVLARTDAGLRFKSKRCVYDSELVPNSLIYPV